DTLRALVEHRWPGNIRELKNLMQYVAATCHDPVIEPWHLGERLAGAIGRSTQPAPRPVGRRFRPLAEELRELERRRINEARKAAELLEVPLRTFYDKLKALGLGRKHRTEPE